MIKDIVIAFSQFQLVIQNKKENFNVMFGYYYSNRYLF